MGYVDRRLMGHWELVRAEREEERRFLTQILREQTGRAPSIGEVSSELVRFRARLDAQRPSSTPNLGDFD
jgi:hypothetical protein